MNITAIDEADLIKKSSIQNGSISNLLGGIFYVGLVMLVGLILFSILNSGLYFILPINLKWIINVPLLILETTFLYGGAIWVIIIKGGKYKNQAMMTKILIFLLLLLSIIFICILFWSFARME